MIMNQTVRNVISEDETSYILKEKLEARLRLLFGYPIKVQVIEVQPSTAFLKYCPLAYAVYHEAC
jgi:hypothetical protein